MDNKSNFELAVETLIDGLRSMGELNDIIKDNHGNLSLRYSKDSFVIKPSGVPYNKITDKMIGPQSLRSTNFALNGCKPSVDTCHHREIYKKHPWINAICHTHSPYAVAFAALGADVKCFLTEQADYFGGNIKCSNYSDLNNWGNDVSLQEDDRAILLAHHGALTFGKTVNEAVYLAAQLENICMKNYLIQNFTHEKVVPLSKQEVDKWHKRYVTDYGQKK